jgi:DNA helicase-2/ATP-dependent DNA helicase PcrA
MAREWSKQQEAIFEWFLNPERKRAVVRARAGTGKTSTMIEALQYAPEKRILLCAFNKRIERELTAKINTPRAEAKTLHGLGFGFVKRNWEGAYPDGSRGKRLALEACGGAHAPDAMVALVAKLAGLGKEMCPEAASSEDLVDIALEMDCAPDEDWEDDGWTLERVCRTAYNAMQLACRKDGSVDFADMLYLPLKHRWARGKWDLVVVDEAQDMNAAQIQLALKAATPGGRVIVVGDDRQAIYGFRGADSGSLDRLKREMGAEELPLTTTYRCPRAVVAEAQRLVPDYTAAPTAPEGKVESLPMEALAKTAAPGDFVLSRKNAPLVRVCLAILRAGTRAKVEGRDVGKGLVDLVKKLKPKSIPNFLEKLEAWEDRQLARAAKMKAETAERKKVEVQDQAETLRVLSEGLASVGELEKRIGDLFADDAASGPQVVCSSIHRSKGLEAPRVFVLRSTLGGFGLKKDKAPPVTTGEEANLEYVAITRAQTTLLWVEGEV